MKKETLSQEFGAMAAIFFISLFAVSFPAVSQRSKRISIPKILFFIGKHFGTGVILSTAFCHLLQDSFESLTDGVVKKWYPGVGEQTGFIILAALMVIFLIEYISTCYVDYLHEDPSAPSSPADSPADSRSQSPTPTQSLVATEITPLLPNLSDAVPSSALTDSTYSTTQSSHSHTNANGRRLSHHSNHARPQPQHYLSSIVTNNPRHSRSNDCFYIINDLKDHLNNGEYHLVASTKGKGSCVCVCVCPAGTGTGSATEDGERGRNKRLIVRSPSRGELVDLERDQRRHERRRTSSHHSHSSHASLDMTPSRVGRRRQVVGILVLQFGIMIHSLVIGLTLAITSGSDFTTLVTAIVFHQLFEGLSLGIRIAALPSPIPHHSRSHSLSDSHDDDDEPHDIEGLPSSEGLLPTQQQTTSSSSRRCKSGSSSTVMGTSKLSSKSEEDASSWWCCGRRKNTGKKSRGWLQPVLTFLFAITTPAGLGLGMIVFGRKSSRGDENQSQMAHMLLTQGLMCAISAGMLIYAATVEMIAGDFVFGNLGGGGHAGGHGHSHGEELFEEGENGHEHEHEHERVTPRKRAIAVGSMLAGVVAMGLIGLGE